MDVSLGVVADAANYSDDGKLNICGNHTTYIHAAYPDLITQVPRHKPLPPYYAKAAVKLIDRLQEREAEDAD